MEVIIMLYPNLEDVKKYLEDAEEKMEFAALHLEEGSVH